MRILDCIRVLPCQLSRFLASLGFSLFCSNRLDLASTPSHVLETPTPPPPPPPPRHHVHLLLHHTTTTTIHTLPTPRPPHCTAHLAPPAAHASGPSTHARMGEYKRTHARTHEEIAAQIISSGCRGATGARSSHTSCSHGVDQGATTWSPAVALAVVGCIVGRVGGG
ncbi:hypothetical protein DFH27DRAFT_174868 [Peziza echinospora]|nr:hypothetical protein DFH27DRAFT_174868 [Peziza echinospora]